MSRKFLSKKRAVASWRDGKEKNKSSVIDSVSFDAEKARVVCGQEYFIPLKKEGR